MSEQNILNPSATSTLNPDYTTPIKISEPQIIARWQARSGKPFFRTLLARGQAFDMVWDKRPFADYLALEQWFHQYETDFFSYFDIDRNRYYSGMFADQPQYERIANNQVTISAQFIVVPGLPLFQYPGNWGVESIFREERNGFGSDLAKLSPTVFTNLLLWSEQFDNGVWVLQDAATIAANNATDPLGGSTADTVTEGAGPHVHLLDIGQSIAANALGRTFTFSVWMRVAGANKVIRIALSDATTVSNTLDFTVTTTWTRFSITASNLTNSGTILVGINIAAPGNPTGTTVQVWGAQLEEAAGMGPYLPTTSASTSFVTPTGRWDRRDSNYLLRSEQFDNAVWGLNDGATVAANNATDPLGGSTADTVTEGAGPHVHLLDIAQSIVANALGRTFTFSLWMKVAAGNKTIRIGLSDVTTVSNVLDFVVTTAWTRFSITASNLTNSGAILVGINIAAAGNPTGTTVQVWGAQLEIGPAPTAYTQTTASIAALLAPAADPKYHQGFAYFNPGTVSTDAAEWKYFGYGFRVWAYKGPDMGIMQVFLDGVSQGTVDLYAAAPTASAAVFTVQNVSLGEHRVKLAPTNTKNGASSSFIVTADAIEVMR